MNEHAEEGTELDTLSLVKDKKGGQKGNLKGDWWSGLLGTSLRYCVPFPKRKRQGALHSNPSLRTSLREPGNPKPWRRVCLPQGIRAGEAGTLLGAKDCRGGLGLLAPSCRRHEAGGEVSALSAVAAAARSWGVLCRPQNPGCSAKPGPA